MVVSSFKDARRENCESGPFLNTDHFAESLTLVPASGAQRTVVGHVTEETEAAKGRPDGSDDDQEVIWVKVLRSTSTAKGGIPSPAFGDSITRAGDSRPFSYSGQIRRATPHVWELRFTRQRPTRYGRPDERNSG